MHRRQSLQNRFRLHQKQKLQGQNPRDQLHSRTETTASSVREIARATVISVKAKAATIIAGITIVVTEMGTEADSAREDHRAARADSEETEDLRETAREDRRAKETVREAALREITVRADVSAREDHRAVRDVSEEKTEITVVKDALADRTTRVDSAPAVQEEAAADLTQSLHQS